MSRLLTPEEIEALLAGGPIVSAPTEAIRIGDPVEVLMDGGVVAHGHLVSDRGRLCVRITARAKAAPMRERNR